MMNDGLPDITIVSFVFTPLVITVVLLLSIWRRQSQSLRATLALDTPGLVLASAVRKMPEEYSAWGAAMLAELGQIRGLAPRWRFALGGVRAALFLPRREELQLHISTGQNPVCGALAVALPPLGLPCIYFVTVIMEAIGGSPFTLSSRWSNPDAIAGIVSVIVKLTILCLLAGLPLGLAGWLRGERLRWLSALGMICPYASSATSSSSS